MEYNHAKRIAHDAVEAEQHELIQAAHVLRTAEEDQTTSERRRQEAAQHISYIVFEVQMRLPETVAA